MKVEIHLRQLLYRHDCVVLPGFGAFLLRYRSASYQEESHTFFPPERRLSFNAQLTESDALLAHEISHAESISFRQAELTIQKFVRQLKTHLNQSKTIELEGIGRFEARDHQLIFHPDPSQNFLTNAFGLIHFSQKPVNRKPQKETQPEPQPEIGMATAEVSSQTSSTDSEKSNSIEGKARKSPYRFFKYAAIGIAAIGLSGYLGMSWYSNSVQEHNAQARRQAEQAVERTIQKATFSIQAPLPEVVVNVKQKKGKYHIIAGAFRNPKNAQQKVKMLRKKGFKAREIGVNEYGLHQISYASFDNRSKALQKLNQIQEKVNSAAWLFVKQLK